VLAAKSVGSSGIVPGHHPKSPHPKKSGGADFAAAAIAPPELQIRFGAARISVAATGPSHARANILYTFFLRFVAEQVDFGAIVTIRGRGTMRQFDVGQVVTCIPDRFLRHAAPGDYRITAVMPDRDGDHMYRVKSPREEHERVVMESLLVKSEGYLPERNSKAALSPRFNHTAYAAASALESY
jgi:hypothetical protein